MLLVQSSSIHCNHLFSLRFPGGMWLSCLKGPLFPKWLVACEYLLTKYHLLSGRDWKRVSC